MFFRPYVQAYRRSDFNMIETRATHVKLKGVVQMGRPCIPKDDFKYIRFNTSFKPNAFLHVHASWLHHVIVQGTAQQSIISCNLTAASLGTPRLNGGLYSSERALLQTQFPHTSYINSDDGHGTPRLSDTGGLYSDGRAHCKPPPTIEIDSADEKFTQYTDPYISAHLSLTLYI
jgi:hypothetical protein